MTKKDKTLEIKKERLVSITLDVKFIMKLIAIGIILISIWYIIYFKHIYIYLHETSKYKYYLFMTLVSILTLLITLAIGLWFGNLGKIYKLVILIMILYFAYLGYAYLGLGIEFRTNYGLLRYEIFETNSKKGIKFFVENIYLLIILYFISLPFESEK